MKTLPLSPRRESFVVAGVLAIALATSAGGRLCAQQAAQAGPAATPAGAAIAIDARSFGPGEVLVVTVTVPPPVTDVRVRLFDRTIAAFPLEDGRWRALAGIDLEQRFGSYTVVAQAIEPQEIHEVSRVFVVRRRAFPTRTLRVAPDFVNPPPAIAARIKEDQTFTRAVFARSAPARLWNGPFVRPVPQAANSRFGTRSVFNGEPRSPHAGTDFPSPAGTPVRAPNGGRIVAARELFFTGNTVIIDHGLGTFSLMAHMLGLDVAEGEDVVAGQRLGLVGATGRVTGPHLHWAMAVAGARVDPMSVLALLGERTIRQ